MEPYISYIPKRRGKAHIFVPLILFILGFTAMLTSVAQPQVRMPLQLICLIFVVAGIQLTTRFALCFYEYAVYISSDGTYELRVTKLQGKYRTVVCKAPMHRAVALSAEKKPDFSSYSKNIPIYSFCVNMFAESTITLLFDRTVSEDAGNILSGDGKSQSAYAAVKLESDGEFSKELFSLAGKGKIGSDNKIVLS
ncbi:MAG: hypothetical protein U0M08_02565 [Clostridia bacterium]|nr:hypothetical protein [Clostridia bacterium]